MKIVKKPLEGFGQFSKLHTGFKTYRIIGFDTEDNAKGTPLSFAFYDGEKHYYTRNADNAIRYIYNYPETSIFVCHNLEYDIINLFKHCDYVYIQDAIYTAGQIKVTLVECRNYFINSGSFFAGKLEAMGELIGFPKLPPDVFNDAYVKRDAEITQKFTAQFQEKVNNEWQVPLGVTIGQMSMRIFRTHYMINDFQITYNNPKVLDAYYGGRVEMFYKGIIKNKVYVSDINSCYPAAMRDNPFPDTSLIEPSSIKTHKFGYGKFKVFVPFETHIPPLPFRSKSGRLFFPVGAFTGVWTYAEINYALDNYPGFTIMREYWGEGTNAAVYPFEKFINDFYDRRAAAKVKSKADPKDLQSAFEVQVLKLLMNNLYGKFAQHKPEKMLKRRRLSKAEQKHYSVVKEKFLPPFWSYELTKPEPKKTANYLWGVYITSYARIYLLDQILKVHHAGSEVIYCDTDSIMYSGDNDVLSIGPELGQLDKETFDLGIFRQAKGYLLCNRDKSGDYIINKAACKGVALHTAKDFIIKGVANFRKPIRLKESLVRSHAAANLGKDEKFYDEVGANVWNEVKKTMQSVYIKRVGSQGRTRAVQVAEIPALENNAGTGIMSISSDVDAMKLVIKDKKQYINHFADIVIPPDWFKNEGPAPETVKKNRKVIFLSVQDLIGMEPETVWFAGEILKNEKNYFFLRLTEFKGQILAVENMRAKIDENFLMPFLDVKKLIVKKQLEISLAETYIENEPLILTVQIKDGKK